MRLEDLNYKIAGKFQAMSKILVCSQSNNSKENWNGISFTSKMTSKKGLFIPPPHLLIIIKRF